MRSGIRLVWTALLVLLSVGCSGGGAAAPADEQVLRWGIVGDPEPTDAAWDLLSKVPANVPWNLFDPLVKVDEKLEAVPNVAERWEWSDGGRTLTFHLRRDGRWTNGDPLTAHDYVFGWRWTLAEDRPGSDAGIFSAIIGTDAYVSCDPDERECERLWDDVGVRAVDDHTLEVRLVEPQPWFPALVGGFSCVCFGALHRPTVERFGDDWAKPEHIVTSGPFKLADWKHGDSLTLVRNEQWRDADSVALERIEIRFFRKHRDAAHALVAGELDVTDAQIGSAASRAVYPWLKTQFVAITVDDIPDPRQRRAMALALDRRTIARKVPEGQARPATSLTADGVPGFGRIASDFLRSTARLEEARRLLAIVPKPRRAIKLWSADAPAWRAEAAEIRAAWRRLGIDVTITALPWEEYTKLLAEDAIDDAFLMNWVYDAPYPANFFDAWRCGVAWYPTGHCNRAYDRLLDRAARERDEERRLDLYARAEEMLTGAEGAMAVIPLWWGSRTMLERPNVRDSFELNEAGQVDLTNVRIARD